MAEIRQRTNEEQQMARQSAPRPLSVPGADTSGAVDGFVALESPIGIEAIHKAVLTLQKYKEGKANLERRIVENEQWYKLRHWRQMDKGYKPGDEVEPVSGWLFNCIANKHADAMDNIPAANILPREEGDKAEAEMLSDIIPVLLEQCEFESVYDDVWTYKLKSGTGVWGVYWDASKLNGLGDVSLKRVDLINLFWEPGITDIQDSRNVFHVQLVDNEVLLGQYPQLAGKLSSQTIDVAKYVYDDTVDTTEKSVVVDWYYKKAVNGGAPVLHYCKFCNDVVLFATENDPQYKERGFYDHGRYPFVFDPMFRVEGTPAGFGYIDVGKSAQEYIDRANQAIMKNLLWNAKPRFFVRNDGAVNEKEYADTNIDLVHVDGNLGQDSVLPITAARLDSIYYNILNGKIDELKETTGNRDVVTGGTTGGATAASAIAAMQEAANKLSRDANKSAYRAFREVVWFVIELIRQFYDLPRCFRIMGEGGTMRFVQYSNEHIRAQQQGEAFGLYMGVRVPMFDIEVTAEKSSPYAKISQNELALQFYNEGFFEPARAQQALTCLDMMDFDHKEEIMGKISQNGAMLQQMQMMAQLLDRAMGTTEFSEGIAQQYGVGMPSGGAAQSAPATGQQEEPANVRNARRRQAEGTSPT